MFANRHFHLFMVALWNRDGIGRPYIFSCCGLFFLSSFFFSSPNLSRRRLDVCHTSTHGVALVRIQDAGLKPAALGSLKTQDAKKSPKIAIWAPSHNFVKAIFSEGFTETLCTGVYFQWMDSLKMQKQYSIFSEGFTETTGTEICFQWMVHWNIGHWNLFSVNIFADNKVKIAECHTAYRSVSGLLISLFRPFSL